VVVRAGWSGPGRWRREALTALFSPAPQEGLTPLHFASQSGHLEVVEALLAKGADVEAKTNVSIEPRLRPVCISLTHAHAECARLPLVDVPVCTPLLLSLKAAHRLRGLSAIANTRLGQSGSGPQRDTVHHKSLQRVQDIVADPSPSHLLAVVNEVHDMLSYYCNRGRPMA
jgi:ankyrin repeat protein